MADKSLPVRLKIRTKTESQWNSSNEILLPGEIGISSDKNGIFKVGDGKTAWGDLEYSYTNMSISTPISITSSGKITLSSVKGIDLKGDVNVTGGVKHTELTIYAPMKASNFA